MFCNHCGTKLAEGVVSCGSCGRSVQVPGAAPVASLIGEQIRASSRDAASALGAVARDPVSGMVTTWKTLGTVSARAAGIALCAEFALAAAIGMAVGAQRVFGGFLGFYGGSATAYIKVFLAMLVLPATVAAASFGIRRVLGAAEGFAADLFTTGAALAPLGVAILASGLLGMANFEVIALLFLFAMTYLVLMLYRGLTAIGGVSERAGPPSVPILLALSAWLTKVVFAALF